MIAISTDILKSNRLILVSLSETIPRMFDRNIFGRKLDLSSAVRNPI